MKTRMGFFLAFLALAVAISAAQPKPNLVFILADDLGYGDLSCYRGGVPTPHLDRMAREGTRFTQAYVASPICSPSRAALITGQHPARWRITSYLQTRKGNRACEMADFLAPSAPSLPRVLQAAGYRTAHVGKWHLGGGRDVTDAPPFKAYGYDIGFGTYESPEPHPDITATNWIWSAHDPVKRWDRTKWMVDRTLDFLRADPAKPAFVNLWLDDPHTPWIPSEEAIGRGRENQTRANLRKVLVELDRQVGRLLDALREKKSDRPTLVIFMSDNGPLPTYQQSRTAGLRGSKLSLYEGGTRVPLIAWWPDRVPAGRVDEATVVSSLDVFPTFVEIAGATLPRAATKVEGQSMVWALFGSSVVRSAPLFWEYGRNTNSFAYPQNENRSPNLAMREGDWKLLVQANGENVALFHLGKDPNEQNNLAEREPARAARMRSALLEWRNSLP